MAYSYTRPSNSPTELSGQERLINITVTPDAATGNVTVTEFGTVDMIVGHAFNFTTDLSANCIALEAGIDGTTVNKVNFKLWNTSGTAATAFASFALTLLVH